MQLPGRRAIVFIFVAALGGCAGAAASGGAAGGESAPGGLFTLVQSNRGESTFNTECAACHAPREFSGRVFTINWEDRSVGDFFAYISEAMPYDEPGSLSERQYADLTAYVLRLNGFPSGATELPPDRAALSGIRFVQAD